MNDNHFDHRPDWSHGKGKFNIADVEAVETTDIGDYIIRLHNGEDHYYRCSCCIVFDLKHQLLLIS